MLVHLILWRSKMEKTRLAIRVERWFRFTAPIITMIFLILLYNMLSEKSLVRSVINTLSPFLFSFLIAWLLNPLVVFFSEKFKLKRWVSTLIVIVGIITLLVLMFMWVIPQFIDQFTFLSDYLPKVISELTQNIEELASKVNIDLDSSYVKEIENEITALVKTLFSGSVSLISSSLSIVGGVISGVFITLMMFMAGIYILIDFDKFNARVNSIVPSRFKEDFDFLASETNRVVVGYLRGLIVETVLVGIMAYVAFLIAGIEGALVFGVIIGITNIIPYLGPYVGAVPVALFALTESVQLFVIVVIIVIVVQQIDGIIIKPKVFGKTTDVHPSVSIIAIILFGEIFGFIGVVFAIPIAGFTIIIIKFVYNKLLEKYPEQLK